MRIVPALLLLAVSLPAAAGERAKCNDLQVQLGLCDADGYLSGPLVSEQDMEILRNATADDFAFMDDPAVKASTERLGKSLEAFDDSAGDYLRAERQMQEELRALEALMRDNPALFEALIAEEQQKAAARPTLKPLPQPAPTLKPLDLSAKPKPVLKPLDLSAKPKPVLKPLDLSAKPKPVLKPLDLSTKPKPVLKPLDFSARPTRTLQPLVLPELDPTSPTPRLDALRLARKPPSGSVRPLPVKVGVIPDAARAPATDKGAPYAVGKPQPYVVGKPVQPRTWAGWAWDTAGAAWTWVVGE